MPLALILSSYVAAGRVGGMAQALALSALAIDPVLVPTVEFGRTPGNGDPGGGLVAPERFEAMLEGVRAAGTLGLADAVITGHFSHPDQVSATARTLDAVRVAERPGAFTATPVVIVDPILGDHPRGLYVKPEVAEAVRADLLMRADVLTPNLWELGFLTGAEPMNAAAVAEAARRLPALALVTSVPAADGEVAMLWAGAGETLLITHRRFEGVPNGTGDLVTAMLAAHLVLGETPASAVVKAAHAVALAARTAAAWGAPELPIVALGPRLSEAVEAVRVERL